MLRILYSVLLALFLLLMLAVPDSQIEEAAEATGLPELRERARAADDLAWIVPAGAARTLVSDEHIRRSALVDWKRRRSAANDVEGIARANALLAGEAFHRSVKIVDIWLPRRDRVTGLYPRTLEPDGQVWAYGDNGADWFPHLTIAARLFAPDRYSALLDVLAAERRLSPALPDTIDLATGSPRGDDKKERIFSASEYAKDGLLPLLERLGPDPWLGRLVEMGNAVLDVSSTPTAHHGMIPADSTEVNGNMLQVYIRLYWATGDQRYLDMAERIGATYLEDVFPTTTHLPPNRWDFVEGEPLDRRRFRLSDHGNEALSGLIEWHLAETVLEQPDAGAHRVPIRRMLDRLLDKARNPDGMWFRVIEIPSGKIEQEGLTDSWGYVFQAYLTQAYIETRAKDGDPERAARYRQAALTGLQALPKYRYYGWEKGATDGYADAIEGAVYLLDELKVPAAEAWVDDQMAVLYGSQDHEGRVMDGYLDGNFVRTSLLYGLWLTQGARLEPWSPDVLVGAAPDGECLALSAYSAEDWNGRLVFDTPRHRLYGRLPADYPRLNKWPEWFTADEGVSYTVTGPDGKSTEPGEHLSAGLPLSLQAGAEQQLRVCRAA